MSSLLCFLLAGLLGLLMTTALIPNPQVLCVVPQSCMSAYQRKPFDDKVPYIEIMQHIEKKMSYEAPNEKFDNKNGDLGMTVVSLESIKSTKLPTEASILMLIGMGDNDEEMVKNVLKECSNLSTVCSFECSANIHGYEKLGSFTPSTAYLNKRQALLAAKQLSQEEDTTDLNIELSWKDKLDSLLKNDKYMDRNRYEFIHSLWERQSTEDTLFLILVLIDSYTPHTVASVQAVTTSDNTGLTELKCMVSNCKDEMVSCFSSPKCREALDCLNKCKSNDQVCSYKCITSYETKEFEQFAQCILQKYNCMGNKAVIPMTPDPQVLTSFRNQPLTPDTAEEIFVGHLQPRAGEKHVLLPDVDDEEYVPWSWKVVAGVNPSYDYFSDQHQIFYRENKRRSIMWYDPVFKVVTLDGQEVWRRRHYRVRRHKSKVPGTFSFTVLDNGVLSDEYWRILDCADDLSWAIFYYSGAASAAGTSYTGGLLCTRDGEWPLLKGGKESDDYKRIVSALQQAGLEPFELFEVKKSETHANPPPLEITI